MIIECELHHAVDLFKREGGIIESLTIAVETNLKEKPGGDMSSVYVHKN